MYDEIFFKADFYETFINFIIQIYNEDLKSLCTFNNILTLTNLRLNFSS